jgi:hypothetical protein
VGSIPEFSNIDRERSVDIKVGDERPAAPSASRRWNTTLLGVMLPSAVNGTGREPRICSTSFSRRHSSATD